MRTANRYSMVLGVAVVLTAAACGSSSDTAEPGNTTNIETAVVETTPATTTAETTAPVNGATYATKAFDVPFDVTVPAWLPNAPSIDQPDFVTWETPDGVRAVRALIPVAVYPPDGSGTTPPPKDYLTYLLAQADHGAHFTDQTQTTVGGRPATILTASSDDHLEGSIGCPEATMAAGDCFGLQPDLSLRIAVIDDGDKTLLVWLRTNVGVDAAVELASFDQMLASIRFSDRDVEAPVSSSAGATPIDGVWTATWTLDELAAAPLLDPSEVNDENWGQYTLTFAQGQATAAQTNPKKTSTFTGTFHIEGDTITWTLGTDQFVMRWSISGDQLTLTRDDSLGIGPTPFIVKPFTRQP